MSFRRGRSTEGAGLPTTLFRTVGDRHFDVTARLDYILRDVSGTLTWVKTTPDPPPPTTLLALGAAKSTIGAGLPAVAARAQGDLHYNTADKKEYVVTGVPGGSASDTFDRADSTSLGTSSSGKAWVPQAGIGPAIVSNKATSGDGNISSMEVLAAPGRNWAAEFLWTVKNYNDVVEVYVQGNASGLTSSYSARFLFQNPGTTSVSPSRSLHRNGAALTGGTGGSVVNSTAIGDTIRISLTVKDGVMTASGTNTRTGAVDFPVITHSDGATTISAGQWAGFRLVGAGGSTGDEFFAIDPGTLAWTSTDEYVAGHTHTAADLPPDQAGSTNTIGEGLPGLSGRKNGDAHYDLTNGRLHVHTGTPSGTALSGSGGFPETVIGAGDQIIEYEFSFTGSVGVTGQVSLDIAARSRYSIDVTANLASNNIEVRITRVASTADGGAQTIVFNQTTGFAPVTGRRYFVQLRRTGSTVTTQVKDLVVGTVHNGSYTDGAPLAAANGAYLAGGSAATIHTHYASGAGSLKWIFTDPQYFQGIVPGAIAVANHVLKPGIRMPAATTVRSFVVRFDVALTGTTSGTTVVARRFNNGADTGDSITVTVPFGQAVASATAAVATAQGDIWKFDVTVADGAPADMLLSLDAWG